jgi:hypothetical protein
VEDWAQACNRLVTELDPNEQRARELVRGLAPVQMNWRAHASWSLAQCLDHLAQANAQVGGAMAAALEGAQSGQRQPTSGRKLPHWVAWWFVRPLDPPYRLKFQAPQAVQPDLRQFGTEVLDVYFASHRYFRSVLRAGNGNNLNRIWFRRPVTGFRLAIRNGLAIMAAHDRRHLWQAEQVKRQAAFPTRPALDL